MEIVPWHPRQFSSSILSASLANEGVGVSEYEKFIEQKIKMKKAIEE